MPSEAVQSKAAPLIDARHCSGCGRCVTACPDRIITLEVSGYRKHAVITLPERCTGCLLCVKACPIHAISTP